MVGFIYRRAIAIKDFGERLAHIKVFNIRPLFWASGPVIMLGLALRDWTLKYPLPQEGQRNRFVGMLCDIGKDPAPFLAGVITAITILGFALIAIY